MRFWLSKRLPFGLRAGIVFPIGRGFGSSGGGRGAASSAASVPPPGGAGNFVYVIRGDHGLSKIGVSANPVARIATLQTASPFPLTLAYAAAVQGDAYALEQAAHAILANHRHSGEWFSAPPDIAVAAISSAAFRTKIPIVSVEPALVGQVAALAGSYQAPQEKGVSNKAFMTIMLLPVAGLAWSEIGFLGFNPAAAIISNLIAVLGFYWLLKRFAST